MSDEERRIYHLRQEDVHPWADMDDDEVYPEQPRIPDEMLVLFADDDEVDQIDGLRVYGFKDPPEFDQEGAVEATPEELAGWLAARDRYLDVTAAYRTRMAAATRQYEEAHQEGMKELRAALAEYKLTEDTLKARSTELAGKLHEHREAARVWMEEQETKRQENLDVIHGPRAVVIYEPANLWSSNMRDRVARIHLVTCTRRPERRKVSEGVRAQDAWQKLTDPGWPPATWDRRERDKMRVKLCSFCKPWLFLKEHAGVTGQMLDTELKLTEWPDGMEP